MIIFLKMARGHCLSSKLRDRSTKFYDIVRPFSTQLKHGTDTSFRRTIGAIETTCNASDLELTRVLTQVGASDALEERTKARASSPSLAPLRIFRPIFCT